MASITENNKIVKKFNILKEKFIKVVKNVGIDRI